MFSSNLKIVISLISLCFVLMSSVFVYHQLNHPVTGILSTDEKTIFSTSRDIKPFELTTSQNKKFTNQDFSNHWTLLFFGFTHCATICPTTLSMLGKAYQNLHEHYPNLQVVLVSLDPERDTRIILDEYVKKFHADFIGVSGKITTLRSLQGQLGIASVREDDNSTNYQIQHTSSILLINPQGKWAGIFKYGMSPEQFSKEFIGSMNFLNA